MLSNFKHSNQVEVLYIQVHFTRYLWYIEYKLDFKLGAGGMQINKTQFLSQENS